MDLTPSQRAVIEAPAATYFANAFKGAVTANAGTLEPGFDEMMREMEMHLAFKVLGTVVCVSFVALAVHYFRVVSREASGGYSTFFELGDGPVLLLCISALLGIAALVAYFGRPSEVYWAMHLPVLLAVCGTFVWAWLWRDAPGDTFVWSPLDGGVSSVVWGVVMALVVVFAVTEYVRGNMRLDGLHFYSGGMIAILAAAAVLAVCCGRVFELFVVTLRHGGFTDDSLQFAGVYAAGVVGMALAVVVAVEAVDRALTLFSGSWNTTFGPAPALGGNIMLSQTGRALRLGIMAVVALTAALTWRREKLLVLGGPVSGASLESEWRKVGLSLVAAPLVAAAVVAGTRLLVYSPAVYRTVWGLCATGVVLTVATGVVPWTNSTIAIAGVAVGVGALELALHYTHRRPALLALVLGALFSVLRAAYRQWTAEGADDPDTRSLKWLALVFPVAAAAEMYARRHDTNDVVSKELVAIARTFAQAMLFYAVLQRFTPDLEEDTVEGNEPASTAFDSLLLAGLLLSAGGAATGFRAPDDGPSTGAESSLASWVLSAGVVGLFVRVRAQPEIREAVGALQDAALAQYKKAHHDALLH